MSTRSTLTAAMALALLTTLLVGGAGAAGPEERAANLDYYMRTRSYSCDSGDLCQYPAVIARCRPGDFAMSGAAWRSIFPTGAEELRLSKPWRKNGAARGWYVPGGGFIGRDDAVVVQVICKRN